MPGAFYTAREVSAHFDHHVFDEIHIIYAAEHITTIIQNVLGANLV
jgi:hypothetical protein